MSTDTKRTTAAWDLVLDSIVPILPGSTVTVQGRVDRIFRAERAVPEYVDYAAFEVSDALVGERVQFRAPRPALELFHKAVVNTHRRRSHARKR